MKMRICKECLVPMSSVMSFSKDKREKFDRCPKCYGETKHRKIDEKELTFGEVLNNSSHLGIPVLYIGPLYQKEFFIVL